MSQISQKPKVREVDFTLDVAKTSLAVAKTGLAVAKTSFAVAKTVFNAATCVRKHCQEMSSPARQIVDRIPSIDSNTSKLQASIELKPRIMELQQQVTSLCQQNNLPPDQTNLAVALATAKQFLSNDALSLERGIQSLVENPNRANLEAFNQQLFDTNQSVFTDRLEMAVRCANLQVGFNNFEEVAQTLGGVRRVIASDERGRTLVTEIGTTSDGETTIATEVIGMSDSSCAPLLEDFDNALAEAGVQSGPPERKSTGGICELEAAKDFIRRQPMKAKTAPAKKAPSTQTRQATKRQQNQQF